MRGSCAVFGMVPLNCHFMSALSAILSYCIYHTHMFTRPKKINQNKNYFWQILKVLYALKMCPYSTEDSYLRCTLIWLFVTPCRKNRIVIDIVFSHMSSDSDNSTHNVQYTSISNYTIQPVHVLSSSDTDMCLLFNVTVQRFCPWTYQ